MTKKIYPLDKDISSPEEGEAIRFSYDEKEEYDAFHLKKDMIKLFHKHKRKKECT